MSAETETKLLAQLLGNGAARKVSAAPGGWRTLSHHELTALGLTCRRRHAVAALQLLATRSYPEPADQRVVRAEIVARLYGERLAPLLHEVVLAIALNAQHQVLGDFEVSRGGRHGAALTPADVFRPLIRAGASVGILVHNHPSGDPTPSSDDRELTRELRRAGEIVGIPIVDHVVIAARGVGYVSFLEAGLMEEV